MRAILLLCCGAKTTDVVAAGFPSMRLVKPAARERRKYSGLICSSSSCEGFQSQSGLPTQLIFTAKDKSILTARVTKVGTRSAYAPTFFTLSAKQFPGCEVVDLR